jgi:hypothetical protein
LCSDKVGFHGRFAVLKQQLQHFLHVLPQLIQSFPLGVGSWKSRHVAHKELSVRVTLDDCCIGSVHLELIIQACGLVVKGTYPSRTLTFPKILGTALQTTFFVSYPGVNGPPSSNRPDLSARCVGLVARKADASSAAKLAAMKERRFMQS